MRTGSCRDSAWLLVQILRNLGLAARFVSGYLIQLTADVKPLEGPAGASSDFTDLHAWTEVFLPGAGWVGFDPTSGLLAGEGHIPLACTPDVGSAAPISGPLEVCKTDFSYSMTVQRIFESPRVTKPYTDEQWHQIQALGHQVDTDLRTADVRLTMGGEPTFISLDDRNGSEWSTTAMSPAKRRLAVQLLYKMRDRFSHGALLHTGQGKWYPGEELPRWALGCYWRKDGVPIWENQRLFAEDAKDYGYGAPEARKFLEALTRRLQVSFSFTITAYEDVFFHLWKERRLPPLLDPLDPKLKDFPERARLAQIFEEGAEQPIGFVLPLRRIPTRSGTPRWTSQPWFPIEPRMFLTPGDSPMGYRLPLESMPWTKPEDLTYAFDTDPLRRRDTLPVRPERRLGLFSMPPVADEPVPDADKAKPKTEDQQALTLDPAGALRTGSARQAVCFYAPGRLPGGLSRPGRRHRRHRRTSLHAGVDRRLCTTQRYPYRGVQSHSRSRGDRGEYPTLRQLGRVGGKHHGGLRPGPGDAAWEPRSSCWMASTPGPAEATTW